MSKFVFSVVSEDGEILSKGVMDENTEIIARDKSYSRVALNHFKRLDEVMDWVDCNGSRFTWTIDSPDVKVTDLADGDFARLLFLSTYISYGGENKLVYDNGRVIDRNGLVELLQLGVKPTDRLIKKFVDSGVMRKEDSGYYLSPSLFYRGKLYRDIINDQKFVRTLSGTIRSLYKEYGKTRRGANVLGLLYRVIPLVDFHTNCITYGTESIDYLTIEEFATVFGVDVSHLGSKLRSLKIEVDDKKEYVFATVRVGKSNKIYVNPRVYWQPKYFPDKSFLSIFEVKKK